MANSKTQIGKRIRKLRGERTQIEYAMALSAITKDIPNASDVNQGMVSRWEHGLELPKSFTLLRMARDGKTSIAWILTGRPHA